MENVTFLNKNGNKLAGVFHIDKNNPTKFILLVHGFTGTKDENGLFIEAADHFLKKGFSVFRFDMTGSGDSEGDFISVGINEQKEDLVAAISFLKEKKLLKNGKIYLLGFSLGSTISLMCYKKFSEIKAMALWSPAFFPNRDMYPRYQNREILNSLNQNGYFKKSGLKVGRKIIDDLGSCNIVPHVRDIYRPTLVIHGEKDDKISVDSSKIAFPLINGNGKLTIIPGACHSFRSPNGIRNKIFNETSSFFSSVE